MKIGIIGFCGVVGGAYKAAFERLGHQVVGHDIQANTKIEDVLDTELCYICVPTPSSEDGACNTRIVEKVIDDLYNLKYKGITAIKSTIAPGTTDKLIAKYDDRICGSCEVLRERYNFFDAENINMLVVGTNRKDVFELIVAAHGRHAKRTAQLSPLENELYKYFWNNFNSTLITFANSFATICEALGADYTKIKDTATINSHIPNMYLDSNSSTRGLGGMCLPKDLRAIAHLSSNLDTNITFFHDIIKQNEVFPKTAFPGMRLE